MRNVTLLFALAIGCSAGVSADSSPALLLQKPTLSKTHIAFVYAGDLWTVPRDGGAAQRLTSGAGVETNPLFSPDGTRLAYVPMRRAFNVWERYRGGDTTPIWLASLADSKVEKIPRENSNDYNPLWIGDKVYFLSDRNGPVTLFSYDTHSRQVKEEVKNTGLDFKSIGAGADAIVIEQFGGLALFDLKTGALKPVPVRIAGDLPEVRDRMVNVSSRLTSAHLSPNATRALFEARGEIVTVPAEKGDARVITNTPPVMDRSPSRSPDGLTSANFPYDT